MTAEDLLHSLKSSGIELRVEGESLKWRAPKGIMKSELRKSIKNHKANLLALLQKNEADDYRQNVVNQIIQGDCLEVLKGMPDNSIDSIVTDPPYGYKFMGKSWDKAIPGVEIWKECLRILKPGAFAFVMSGPRQDCFCRMILNLEAAGFRTNITSLYWTFASGFPKSRNLSKAIDKKAGVAKKIICRNPNSRENCNKSNTIYESGTAGKTAYITESVTEEAKMLDGSYIGFQPKPAVEIIIAVMKACDKKTNTEQALSNRKGCAWFDDCKIPRASDVEHALRIDAYSNGSCKSNVSKNTYYGNQVNKNGRFPANLLVSDNVLGDSSRYFSLDAWADFNINDLPEQVQRTLPFLIVPKASKKEKDAGLEYLKEKSIQGRDPGQDGRNVAFKARLTPRKNTHPTVKPIKLMAYLITMGSRQNDIILDPFAGSGTTCVAAKMLNRRYIGVELSSEYHEIARRRIEHAAIKDAA